MHYDLASYDPNVAWQQPQFGLYCTPLGEQVGGQPLIFDLREHGPHGLMAGTTGSGKSE